MKIAFVVALVAGIAGTEVMADASAEPVGGKGVPAKVARPRRPRVMKPNGGIFARPESNESRPIALVNAQKTIAAARIADCVDDVRFTTRLPVRLDAKDAPASVTLVDDDSPALVVVPDEFRATVNVRRLTADGADDAVVNVRLRKEISRATLMAIGSGLSSGRSLNAPAPTLKALDALDARFIAPEVQMSLSGLGRLGINRLHFVDYRQACREGWAPAPTNAIQKAIWDKVHEMPAEPLKIKPETKKVVE